MVRLRIKIFNKKSKKYEEKREKQSAYKLLIINFKILKFYFDLIWIIVNEEIEPISKVIFYKLNYNK